MNRLGHETSPYLRQHAGNPVDWYPWGPEALGKAQHDDKPLFVSIGYASCHWCHVMAHETFEDATVADDLARSFVSIKVDREERPDIDAVYMGAAVALTGSGGWPLSVFCTPDGQPFYAGTYFPPSNRHGLPSFRSVLAAIREAWEQRRPQVEAQAAALTKAVSEETGLVDVLARGVAPTGRAVLGPSASVIGRVVDDLAARFDSRWGGFSPAPKFPRPDMVELCLRHHRRTGDQRARDMAVTTLRAMAAGGIYDHLAGGFCRYSTDRQWLVPHFEKMLTDQALLARAYLHAWQATADHEFFDVASETIEYVLGELSGPGGAFFSSEDADADGVEGGHATFTPSEVRDALRRAGRLDVVDEVLAWYGVTDRGNHEGRTVLNRALGAPLSRPPQIEEARAALLHFRHLQPRPAVDDKVITEWNAMFVATLAEAAAVTGNERWAGRAEQAMAFLLEQLRRPDGRMLRSWQAGRARHLGLASDVVWVVEACTRLGELTGRASWTTRAVEAADQLLEHFWDGTARGTGGLFTTGHDAEPLIVRAKDFFDGATPSANAVAAGSLLRLGALAGEERFVDAGSRIIELATPFLVDQPGAVVSTAAATSLLDERAEVVIAGERPDLLEVAQRRWLPSAVLAWGQPSASPLWADRVPGFAYICHNFSCELPLDDPETLACQLDRMPELVHSARPATVR